MFTIKPEIGVEIYVNLMSSRCKCLTQFVQLRWRGVMLSGGVAWCCSGGENRRSGVGSWSGGLPIIGLTSPSASIQFEKTNNFSAPPPHQPVHPSDEASSLKEVKDITWNCYKGSHPKRKVQFFLTLFKRPLTHPPLSFEHHAEFAGSENLI